MDTLTAFEALDQGSSSYISDYYDIHSSVPCDALVLKEARTQQELDDVFAEKLLGVPAPTVAFAGRIVVVSYLEYCSNAGQALTVLDVCVDETQRSSEKFAITGLEAARTY